MNALADFLNFCGEYFVPLARAFLLQSAVVAVAILLIDILFGRRMRPVLLYSLWLLVFLKLLIPVRFTLPTGLQVFTAEEHRVELAAPSYHQARLSLPSIASSQTIAVTDATSWRRPVTHPSKEVTPRRSAPIVDAFPMSPVHLTASGWLFALWVGGVALLAAFMISRTRKLSLLRKTCPLASSKLQTLLGEASAHLQITRIPELRMSPEHISPTIFGMLRPVIIVPKGLVGSLSETDLRSILLHELLHFKRGDLLWQTFQSVLTVLHFYNPFVWLANRRIALIREQAVDRCVIHRGNSDPEAYAQTLVNVARASTDLSWAGSLSIIVFRGHLRSRVQRIISTRATQDDGLGLVGLATLIAISSILLPLAKADVGKIYPAKAASKPQTALTAESIGDLFRRYEFFADFMGRRQAILVSELVSRTNAADFLFAVLRKEARTASQLEDRKKAIYLTAKLGERARPGVPLLIAALDDEDLICRTAVNALRDLGPIASDAIQPLIDELSFQKDYMGQEVWALLSIAPNSERVQTALVSAIQNPAMRIASRREILWVLPSRDAVLAQGRFTPALKKILEEGPAELREEALKSLRQIEPANFPAAESDTNRQLPSLAELLTRINGNPDSTDMYALADLGRKGTNILKALPRLMELLSEKALEGPPALKTTRAQRAGDSFDSRIPLTGGAVLSAIMVMGSNAAPAVPLMIKALDSEHCMTFHNAIAALGEVGPEAMQAKPILLKSLDETNPRTRWSAANALRKIDPSELNRALPILLEGARKAAGRWEVYFLAPFQEIGTSAKTCLPELLQLTKSDPFIHFAAIEAIVAIQPGRAQQFQAEIQKCLDEPNSMNRTGAAKALVCVATAAPELRPKLRDYVGDKDPKVQEIIKSELERLNGRKNQP